MQKFCPLGLKLDLYNPLLLGETPIVLVRNAAPCFTSESKAEGVQLGEEMCSLLHSPSCVPWDTEGSKQFMYNSKNNPKHKKKKLHTFFTVRVINTGRSHAEKLWSLCLWRYSKASVTWLWAVELDKMICRGVTSVTLRVCLATGKSFRRLEITVFQTFRSCPCDTQLQTWQHCGWLWEQPSFGSRNLWSYPAPFPGKLHEYSLSQQANTHVGAEGTALWYKHVQF